MSAPAGHQMIRASAGTGKTHALVNRFLRLVAGGEAPERIIALTFTRKAAGEFLQSIFLRLCEAAGGAEQAAELHRQIGAGQADPGYFVGLLERMVRALGGLQLGTIDSFFARIVGAFPYELGLARPHRILESYEQDLAVRHALDRLLAGDDPQHTRTILDLYKNLTWGTEEKSVYRTFEERLRASHGLFIESGTARLWGNAGAIFPEPPWWLLPTGRQEDDEDPEKLAGEILAHLPPGGAQFETAFTRLVETCATWQPGRPLTAGTLMEHLFEARTALAAGEAEILFNRRSYPITEPLAGLLYRLLGTLVRREIARRVLVTRTLGELLAQFDRLYEVSVREVGALVFADLPLLLVRGLMGGTPVLSASDLAYRLDGRADHWLLDEFQDTSRIQWQVLSAFIDEVLQDAEGRRSFFCVGDVKQSIYGWRGGDARLFDEIAARYGVPTESLGESWRSAPPVLDCVNELFGAGLGRAPLDREILARWERHWTPHRPSRRTAGLAGYAAWGVVEDADSLAAACVGIIQSVEPLRRGLSCAVLVRRNDEVAALTQALRQAGIPASMEGVSHIALDNVAGLWVLAFLQTLARPGEAFPAAYLRLPDWLGADWDYGALAAAVRAALAGEGSAAAVARLLAFLGGRMPRDAFLELRCEQLLEAATRFEATGLDSLEALIGYLQAATVAESALANQVQVMTVHKAKGLGFDMVIVAGFGESELVQARGNPLHVQRGPDGAIQWILEMPNKWAMEQDPALQEAGMAGRRQALFEALCVLYVALTRPRHALYCVAPMPAANRSEATWHQVLEAALGGDGAERADGPVTWRREWGRADWFAGLEKSLPPVADWSLAPLAAPLPGVPAALRPAPSPSREAHGMPVLPERLRSRAGRDFGTRMHNALAAIEWLDFADRDGLQRLACGFGDELAPRLLAFWQTPLAREVFSRPAHPCRLWREKPYLLRRQDTVATGIIDRALVFVDETGAPVRAAIYDFKTDALDPRLPADSQLRERYGVQLERYREALAVLTGLAPERISATLVPV